MSTLNIPVRDLKFTNSSPMAKEIGENVKDYFQRMGSVINNKHMPLSKKGNWSLHSKALFFLLGFCLDYCFLVFTDSYTWVKLTEIVLLVFFASGIGFSIMHDGNHGSFSKHKWLNTLAGLSLNILGAIRHIWIKKHNAIHHHGTNVDGIDEDIEAKPLLRLHDAQPWYWIHKYQHWYFFIAYAVLYIFWVLVKDFIKYFSGKIMGEKISFSLSEHLIFWVSKILYFFTFFYIPFKQVGFNQWLIGYLIFSGLLGIVISTVFQLAHIVEGLKHPTLAEANGGETMEHQISTTADFAPNNRFINFWVGGLNLQIEHHLFPKISHVHYKEIHKIVRDACKKYNFEFKVFPSVFKAIVSHIKKLKEFGKNPKKPIVVQL